MVPVGGRTGALLTPYRTRCGVGICWHVRMWSGGVPPVVQCMYKRGTRDCTLQDPMLVPEAPVLIPQCYNLGNL